MAPHLNTGDNGRTTAAKNPTAERLLEVTHECLMRGVAREVRS